MKFINSSTTGTKKLTWHTPKIVSLAVSLDTRFQTGSGSDGIFASSVIPEITPEVTPEVTPIP